MMSETTRNEEVKGRRFPVVAVIAGAALCLAIGGGLYQHSKLTNLGLEVKGLQHEVTVAREWAVTSDKEARQAIEKVYSELDVARKSTVDEVSAAKQAAKKQSELIAARLAKKSQDQQQELAAKISEVKTSTDLASENLSNKLTDITTQVGSVKTEVSTTRSQVEKNTTDLHRATGDMGVMSGLIATNSKELAALRSMGDRNYYEFKIPRNQIGQKVADIQVTLKKSDEKRNRFTLEILADDKRIEKKDRTVNEPVQFYVVSTARQPYELVVNEVKKDFVAGYLATPKATIARK